MEPENGGIDRRQERKLFLTFISLCGLLMAAGVALGSEPSVGQPLELGNLSEAHIVEIRDVGGRTMLSGEFRTRRDSIGNMEKDAALIDRTGSRVIGEIEIEVSGPNASDRGQELEIDVITLAPLGTFTLFIDDRAVVTFASDDRGSVDVEIESVPHGQEHERSH